MLAVAYADSVALFEVAHIVEAVRVDISFAERLLDGVHLVL